MTQNQVYGVHSTAGKGEAGGNAMKANVGYRKALGLEEDGIEITQNGAHSTEEGAADNIAMETNVGYGVNSGKTLETDEDSYDYI